MRSSKYEARVKFGGQERCVRVARGVAVGLTMPWKVKYHFSNSCKLLVKFKGALICTNFDYSFVHMFENHESEFFVS